jgi:hypothetical protein
MKSNEEGTVMGIAATTDDLPCKRKSCLSDGEPGALISPGPTACSPADPGKTLKGILKENFRAQILEKAVILIFLGLIVAIMHFWLGLIR